MTTIRTVPIVVVALMLAAPAAAQRAERAPRLAEQEWVRELERAIDEQVREMASVIDQAQPRPQPRPRRGDPDGPEVTEPFTRTLRLDRNGTFDLSNIAGDLVVTGGGGNDVQINAVKRVRGRDQADAKTLLQEVQIVVRESANRIEVRTEYPREGRNLRGAAVDYTVSMPQDASAILRTVSGDVRVTNVRGELRAETVSGDLMTTGARRLAVVKSVSGDVQIIDAESQNTVAASTVSGDLIIRNLKAREIDLNTVSGNLQLDGTECERATLRTVNGDIQYAGSLARNGRYEMNTHSGDIRLMVSTSGFDLEASTFSGDVRSDYALTLRGSQVSTGGRGRRGPQNRAIRGSFGDGGAILSLQSFSGDVVITRR